MSKKNRRKTVPQSASRNEDKKEARFKHPNITDGKPCWRFSNTDRDGDFAWPKGEPEEGTIVTKLHDFDSMKWKDIEGSRHHFLTPSSLSSSAVKRLVEIEKDDQIDHLFSFALGGVQRIICIRQNDIAMLLWYDPCHAVCPSSRKHT